MQRVKKAIPRFKNEAEERRFWKTADSTEYLDWKKAKANPSFPRLKPSMRSISIRLPESLIHELKSIANRRDVPYQSLMKIFIAEKIEEETGNRKN